jgi:hypothetical protein
MNFATVTQRDNDGRVRAVILPGSEGKQYHVILRRGPLSAELNLIVNGNLVKPHYAHRTLTYHAMAAVMIAAKEMDYTIAWCANEHDAEKLANLGGKKFVLRNHDNPNRDDCLWGVMHHD